MLQTVLGCGCGCGCGGWRESEGLVAALRDRTDEFQVCTAESCVLVFLFLLAALSLRLIFSGTPPLLQPAVEAL
jgi:hypothetical protein